MLQQERYCKLKSITATQCPQHCSAFLYHSGMGSHFLAWRGPVIRHQASGLISIQNRVEALVYFYPSWGARTHPTGPIKVVQIGKFCFMKQKCQIQTTVAHYKNEATPLRSRGIDTTNQDLPMIYITWGSKVFSNQILNV